MVGAILIGVWATLVMTATIYVAVRQDLISSFYWQRPATAEKYESYATGMISVPVMAGSTVRGYVLTKFVMTVRMDAGAKVSARLQDLIADEAFRAIYNMASADLRDAKKSDLAILTNVISEGINKRAGSGAVKEVLIKEYSYISKDEARR